MVIWWTDNRSGFVAIFLWQVDVRYHYVWLWPVLCYWSLSTPWGPEVVVIKAPFVVDSVRNISFFANVLVRSLETHFIKQLSPQLSREFTCQIWRWYHIGDHCFENSEKCENNGTYTISSFSNRKYGSDIWIGSDAEFHFCHMRMFFRVYFTLQHSTKTLRCSALSY